MCGLKTSVGCVVVQLVVRRIYTSLGAANAGVQDDNQASVRVIHKFSGIIGVSKEII